MKTGRDWGSYFSTNKGPAIGVSRVHGKCEHDGRIVGVWARAFGRGVWFAPGWWKR